MILYKKYKKLNFLYIIIIYLYIKFYYNNNYYYFHPQFKKNIKTKSIQNISHMLQILFLNEFLQIDKHLIFFLKHFDN